MTSPKVICAGVGLNPYLPAGIASAAATRLRWARCSVLRNASATGDPPALWAAASDPKAVRARAASAAERKTDVMVTGPRRGWSGDDKGCGGVPHAGIYIRGGAIRWA